MKEINELIKRIDNELYHFKRRELFPIDTFFTKIYYSAKILESSYRQFNRLKKSRKKNNLLKEARKNFIINCVTATEVYFKDLIKVTPELSKDIRSNAVKVLLNNKGKFDLWEAYQIFHEKDFRLGDILIYFYTFQNIEEINIVMSKLLLIDNFLNEIDKFKLKLDKEDKLKFKKDEICLSLDFPKWKANISDIFGLRHSFVHHINFKDKLGDDKLSHYYEVLTIFISVTDAYFFEKVKMDD